MKIQESFKKAQKAAFQDKTINVFTRGYIPDSEGNDIPHDTPAGSFEVNVQIISDVEVAKKYGLKVNRDILVTYSDEFPIERENQIVFNDHQYTVFGKITRDAYTILSCTWNG